jgi:hypothetical protein
MLSQQIDWYFCPFLWQRISQFNAKRKFRAAAYAAVCMARSMKSLRSNLSKLSGIKTLSEAELLRIRTAFKEVYVECSLNVP